jgi:predicted SprT family Zn-dependent metalloprotease
MEKYYFVAYRSYPFISPDNYYNKKNKYVCKKCGGELVKYDLRTY